MKITVETFIPVYIIISLITMQFFLYYISKNSYDKAPYFFFGNMLGSIIWLIPLTLILTFLTTRTSEYSKVISIGGCDRSGNCAVLTEDGSRINVNFPVVGDIVEVDRFHKWIWEK